jgi:hypothetical protein
VYIAQSTAMSMMSISLVLACSPCTKAADTTAYEDLSQWDDRIHLMDLTSISLA